MNKNIPKMRLIPSKLSINHLVSKVIPAFQKYGDVFQLALPLPLKIFCLRNPDHIRAVSTHKECGKVKPRNMIPKSDSFMGNGIYNDFGDTASWLAKRRELTPAFSEANSLIMAQRFSEAFAKLKERWNGNGKKAVDLHADLLRLVLDFSAHALFSAKLSNEDLDWITPGCLYTEMMFVTLTPTWIPTGGNKKFLALRTRFHQLMERIIQERRQSKTTFPDMLSFLLNTPNAESGLPRTVEEIKAAMFSVYFGTSAMSLSILYSVYSLATQPDLCNTLSQELKQVLNDREPRGEDLVNLPFLGNFVREVLRMYPSFWGSLRYAENPIEFDGYSFPGKSMFAMIRAAAHRHPDFWQDPDEFRPERHNDKLACPHAFLPFGLGSRMCTGKSLASIITPLAVASIVQNFKVEMLNSKLELKYGFGIYPMSPMLANIWALKYL